MHYTRQQQQQLLRQYKSSKRHIEWKDLENDDDYNNEQCLVLKKYSRKNAPILFNEALVNNAANIFKNVLTSCLSDGVLSITKIRNLRDNLESNQKQILLELGAPLPVHFRPKFCGRFEIIHQKDYRALNINPEQDRLDLVMLMVNRLEDYVNHAIHNKGRTGETINFDIIWDSAGRHYQTSYQFPRSLLGRHNFESATKSSASDACPTSSAISDTSSALDSATDSSCSYDKSSSGSDSEESWSIASYPVSSSNFKQDKVKQVSNIKSKEYDEDVRKLMQNEIHAFRNSSAKQQQSHSP